MSMKACLDLRCNGQQCNNHLKTLNTCINNVWSILQEKIKLKVLKKANGNTMNRSESHSYYGSDTPCGSNTVAQQR